MFLTLRNYDIQSMCRASLWSPFDGVNPVDHFGSGLRPERMNSSSMSGLPRFPSSHST